MLRLTLHVIDNQADRIVYPDLQTMPYWSAKNTVWTDVNVSLKQVAFLHVLPYPVTLYSAVKLKASKSPDFAGDLPIFDMVMTISRSPDLE